VYSLEYNGITKILLAQHHVGHCLIIALMSSKAIVAQHCVATMNLDHSCSNVSTMMVEAHGCFGAQASWLRQGRVDPRGKVLAQSQAPTKKTSGARVWALRPCWN
jgi:hypothetical protein